MSLLHTTTQEWLEADGLGGFASGTASGIRTRRYHALLLVATNPPGGRMVLVNGCDAWVETPAGTFAISSQCYVPDVAHPDGAHRIEAFEVTPFPRWIYQLEDGTRVQQEIFVPKDQPMACLAWRLLDPKPGVRLYVRPFMSGREYHALHKKNDVFRFEAAVEGSRVTWRPYPGVPGVSAISNGAYLHEPDWYFNFRYTQDRERGLDSEEDLAAPGLFRFNLSEQEAALFLTIDAHAHSLAARQPLDQLHTIRVAEWKRRTAFPTRLHRSADAYVVRHRSGKAIVAGYPWFTDWARDTFIAIRGLCIATGRLDDARDILAEWAGAVSDGMLPNRIPGHGDVPEYGAVDASLWYVVAVHEYLKKSDMSDPSDASDRAALTDAVQAILDGYSRGTRFGIRMDRDGLLACGEPGMELTWMDAKIGDEVVTPRVGKPVEVQALWINALWIGSQMDGRWKEPLNRAEASFRHRFVNSANGCLFDVIDVNHHAGAVDASFRPNQIFAIGGLPLSLLKGLVAERIVGDVESRLWTRLGLRSLAHDEAGYIPRYEGGVVQRDNAYHQGTVWPWLAGPFVEAWVRVRGGSDVARKEARRKFVEPLLRHLDEAGLEHISEIADAQPPFTPRGCPFQACSVGELLRLEHSVLSPAVESAPEFGN